MAKYPEGNSIGVPFFIGPRPRPKVLALPSLLRIFEVPVEGIPVKRVIEEISLKGSPFEELAHDLSMRGFPFRSFERELFLHGIPFLEIERFVSFKGKRDLTKFLILLESLEEED